MIVVSLDFSTEINNFVILIKYRRCILARMILLGQMEWLSAKSACCAS